MSPATPDNKHSNPGSSIPHLVTTSRSPQQPQQMPISRLSNATPISTSSPPSSSASISDERIYSEKDLESGLTLGLEGGDGGISSSSSGKSTSPDAGGAANEDEGLEVNWNGLDDPCNPQNWALRKKGLILGAISIQTLMVVFYSTSFLSGAPGLMSEFGITSNTILVLGLTSYMFGLAFGPLFLAPMSELYGRRPVYIVSLVLSTMFVLPACLAQNYGTIIVVRFLGAFVGSVATSNAPGSIADIFSEQYRTRAFSVFAIAPMSGPVLGPVVGGFVYQGLGWRWINWVTLIIAGISAVLAVLVPETYPPILLQRKAAKLRRETGNESYRSTFCPAMGSDPIRTGSKDFWMLIANNIKRPIYMGVTEPICIFWELYVAVLYAILYLFFVGYPIVFSELRGWSPALSGLAFAGIGVGTIITLLFEPLNTKIYMAHKIDPDTGKRPPEARIASLCVAAVACPVAVLWFAWTCYPITIHWIWPILAGIPYGIGNTLIFMYGINYLVESYTRYAASALAGNAVARSILGGILPLFGSQMYTTLGPNWAGTMIALMMAVLIPIPWGFYKWGKKLRMRSPMMKELQEEARLGEEKLAKMGERKSEFELEAEDVKVRARLR